MPNIYLNCTCFIKNMFYLIFVTASRKVNNVATAFRTVFFSLCLLRLPYSPESVQIGFLGASSDWSLQSNSPSHSQFFCFRHWPLAQRKSFGPHVEYSTLWKEWNIWLNMWFTEWVYVTNNKKITKKTALKWTPHAYHTRAIHQSHHGSQRHDHTWSF